MPEASYPYDRGRRRIYVHVSTHGVTLTDFLEGEELEERARIVLSPEAWAEVAAYVSNMQAALADSTGGSDGD